jgi:hypothetical protein
MADALRFEVLHGSWVADGEEFAGGEHEVTKPSAALRKLAGSAHDAGVICVESGADSKHVQSQEDGEAALTKAMGEWDDEEQRWTGPWHEGHAIQQAHDREAREAQLAEIAAAEEDA